MKASSTFRGSVGLCLVLILVCFLLACGPRDPALITVYVTETGNKYHRASCRHLAKSKCPMALSRAQEKGYAPCKACRP